MTVTKNDIAKTIKDCGLDDKVVMLHSSLKSFGQVEGGAPSIVDAFLDCGCTLLVPTFCYQYILPPLEKISGNGRDDDEQWDGPENKGIYTCDTNLISDGMGAIPRAILSYSGRVRGYHPVNSFTAAGPEAEALISEQTPTDVYGPIRKAGELGAYIVLAGVGLNRMTAIHCAEQLSGRNLFICWANGLDGKPIETRVGSCSEGFERLAPILAPVERRYKAGDSLWRIFLLAGMLDACTDAISENQEITRCDNPGCIRCRDSVAGGPRR